MKVRERKSKRRTTQYSTFEEDEANLRGSRYFRRENKKRIQKEQASINENGTLGEEVKAKQGALEWPEAEAAIPPLPVKGKRGPYKTHIPFEALNPKNAYHAKLIKRWERIQKLGRTKLKGIKADCSLNESQRIIAMLNNFFREERLGAEFWHNVNFWKNNEKLSKHYKTYQEALKEDELLKKSRKKRLYMATRTDAKIKKCKERCQAAYWSLDRGTGNSFCNKPSRSRCLNPNNKLHLPIIQLWKRQQKLVRTRVKSLIADSNLEESKRMNMLLELFHYEELIGAQTWHNVNFWTNNAPLDKEFNTYKQALKQDQSLKAARANRLRLAQETNEEREKRWKNCHWWEEEDDPLFMLTEEIDQSHFLSDETLKPIDEYSYQFSPKTLDELVCNHKLITMTSTTLSNGDPSKFDLLSLQQMLPELSIKCEPVDEIQGLEFETKPNVKELLKSEEESSEMEFETEIKENHSFMKRNGVKWVNSPEENNERFSAENSFDLFSKVVIGSSLKTVPHECPFFEVPMTSTSTNVSWNAELYRTPLDYKTESLSENHELDHLTLAKSSHIPIEKLSSRKKIRDQPPKSLMEDKIHLKTSSSIQSSLRCKSLEELKYPKNPVERAQRENFNEKYKSDEEFRDMVKQSNLDRRHCHRIGKTDEEKEIRTAKEKKWQAIGRKKDAEVASNHQGNSSFLLNGDCVSIKSIIKEEPNEMIPDEMQASAILPPKTLFKATTILDSPSIQISKLVQSDQSKKSPFQFTPLISGFHCMVDPVISTSTQNEPLTDQFFSKSSRKGTSLEPWSTDPEQMFQMLASIGTVLVRQPVFPSSKPVPEEMDFEVSQEDAIHEIKSEPISMPLTSLPYGDSDAMSSFCVVNGAFSSSCGTMSSNVLISSPTPNDLSVSHDRLSHLRIPKNFSSVTKKLVFESAIPNELNHAELFDDITIKEEFQETIIEETLPE